MYAQTIQDVENPFLYDAALVLSFRENNKGEKIYRLRSLYMDKSGECAITYYGRLTEDQIKEVMVNFCYPGEDVTFDEVHPIYMQDYSYENGRHANGETEFTTIYTPDGLNYKTLIEY